MNAHDAFERSLKKALEPYEVPYNSADWSQLEARMDKAQPAPWRSSLGLYALLLGGTVALGTTIYLLTTTISPAGGGTTDGTGTIALVQDNERPKQTVVAEDRTTTETAAMGADDNGPAESVAQGPDMTSTTGSKKTPASPVSTAAPVVTDDANNEVTIRPSVSEGCPGTAVTFAVNNMPEEGIYLWNFGDGSFSNQSRPSHVFSKAGTFEVMLSHSSVGGGTIQNKPAADRIVIHEIPEASFKFLKQEYDHSVPSVHFENRSQGAASYHWDFGDGQTSDIAHPDHIFKKSGDHTVVLTVTNTKGCTDRSERTIHIESGYNLLATSTFSPNGDGVDDVFIPEALRTLGVRFKLSIHDPRTGQLVYETADPQRPWNGRIANKGEWCTTGDYVWMVEMKDGEKLGGTYNGTIGLLR